ncbi:MAG: DNA-directed DNA polymerase, partial [Nanoarchaeota archaeon]|nr:DNA-directed DNA polymerase [Nanoarchaeota archaeon]
MNNEVKIQFYPLDIDYDNGGNIVLFGKTVDGERIIVKDGSIKPYFWVFVDKKIDSVRKKIENIVIEEKDKIYKVIKTEIHKKFYLGNEVNALKVIVSHPKDIKIIKDEINDLGLQKKEIDIKFTKRYLVDKNIDLLVLSELTGILQKDGDILYINGEVKQKEEEFFKNPKILAIDIEVYGDFTSENKSKKDPILMIAFKGENFSKVVTWKKFKADKYVEFVKSESELIRRFKDIINDYKPDYITGYFSDGFDLPYIKERADKHNIKLNLGLDKSNLIFKRRENLNSVRIKGIPHLDIFKFIRNIMSGSLQLDSYKLDVVAKTLIDDGKKSISLEDISDIWDKGDLKELCEYNLKDADLTYKLCHKILPNLNELVKLIGNPIFDICRMSYGQLVENYLIKRASDFNEICPNRPSYNVINERKKFTYKGGFVMEPIPGLYSNIVFLDFKSLYPTLIVAKNICPSTFNKKSGNKSPLIFEEGKKIHYYFNYKKDGFIPKVVKDLIIRRNRVKEILKEEKSNVLEARSYSLKTIANSMYGYLAFFGARYYCKECAASITAWAREYINDVIKKAQKEFEVIYSDTDSIAINLNDKKKDDALNFLKKINDELPSLMELELENFYKGGIFVSKKGESYGAKKKYAVIDEKNNIKIIGFETVRGDWSFIARDTQKNVIELILKEGNFENALKYVKKIITQIKDNKIELNKMIIKTQLKMNLENYKLIGPHVAVARYMKSKGVSVGEGSVISFIVSTGEGLIRDRSKIPSECKNYDIEYYINNQVIPAVEKIFEIGNIKKNDLLIKDQSKLGDYNG